MNNNEIWRLFWAKTDRTGVNPKWTRPLWAHLIDVANAAEQLWKDYIPNSFKQKLADTLGLSIEQTGHMLSLWIGLHDLGKAIPSFQELHKYSKRETVGKHLVFPPSPIRIHHGYASIAIIIEWIQRQRDQRSNDLMAILENLAAFVGFHHGAICSREVWDDCLERTQGPLGDSTWRQAQQQLSDAVIEAWEPTWPESFEGTPWPTWILGFAGWATLADWVGSLDSLEAHYPDVKANDRLDDYIHKSRVAASQIIHHVALDLRSALTDAGFSELFRDREGKPMEPRPLQVSLATVQLPASERPMLTIVEAPTGEGKTEAALYLAMRQQTKLGSGGIYIAMPTQATSNGLLGRFCEFLERSHDATKGEANVRLIHGNDHLHPDHLAMLARFTDQKQLAAIFGPVNGKDTLKEGEMGKVLTASWFLPKKRALLAPYGVGTVDQTFLGVLFAKHFFLRLFGLAGKTVIFDEVHAYDVYMSHLFERLLSWLHELDTHVIILSATLPIEQRRRLLQAWGAKETAQDRDEYPLVLSIVDGELISDTFGTAQHQQAKIEWMEPNIEDVADVVVRAYRDGAAVGVIVNTVDRSQKLFMAIQSRLPNRIQCSAPDSRMILFHARFPYRHRLLIEHRTRRHFGKNRRDCFPRILVATQVAEQSLDLDFDILFSDLAPIDLLLQRAGRLHRHDRDRPEKHQHPVLTILCANAKENELPSIREIGGGTVYDKLVMWKTWRLLRGPKGWSLPEQYRELIEGVYGNETSATPATLSSTFQKQWLKALDTNKKNFHRDSNEAITRMIPVPYELESLVEITWNDLDEDDETIHPDLRALTRLGGEHTIEVICLHSDAHGLFLDQELQSVAPLAMLPLDQSLHHDNLVDLLKNTVRVTIYDEAMAQAICSIQLQTWSTIAEKTPALRNRYPLVFHNRAWRSQSSQSWIEYSKDLGLVIHKPNL